MDFEKTLFNWPEYEGGGPVLSGTEEAIEYAFLVYMDLRCLTILFEQLESFQSGYDLNNSGDDKDLDLLSKLAFEVQLRHECIREIGRLRTISIMNFTIIPWIDDVCTYCSRCILYLDKSHKFKQIVAAHCILEKS